VKARTGRFDGFKGEDVVLVDCDDAGLQWLNKQISGTKRSAIVVGMEELSFTGPADDVAEKLSALRRAGTGHQYFNSANEQRTIVVSIGEYDDAWWAENLKSAI
jgi:hypothetical protein